MNPNIRQPGSRVSLFARRSVAATILVGFVPVDLRAGAAEDNPAHARNPQQEVTALLQGSVLYHRAKCRVCHSYGATGRKGPSLVDDDWLHCDGSVDGIKKVIEAGIERDQMKGQRRDESMPSASELDMTMSDVDAIARYIHAIGELHRPNRREGASSDPETPAARMELLLRGSVRYHKSDCVKCHYSGAAGGSKHGGPSLVDDEWLHCDGSATGMRRVIVKGIAPEQVKNEDRKANDASMPPANEIGVSDDEVEVIALYLEAIGRLHQAK